MASGDTKTESYLRVAAEGTRADLPSDTCCNTKTQNLILGVANRIMDVEDEVEELKNNPDVVDIVDTYADLQAYDTQHLTENDIIRVLQDETHNDNSTYYRFTKNPDTWTFIGEISGGGSSVNVVQTTGASTTDVMSQNATTSMVFADPGTNHKIRIGNTNDNGNNSVSVGYNGTAGGKSSVQISSATANGTFSIAIGANAVAYSNHSVSIGDNTQVPLGSANQYSVALGADAKTSRQGEVNIGTGTNTHGYNSTSYRVLGGVHDPVDAHDAATKGYVDANAGGPTVVQTTGTSTTDVMSQDATTSMVFQDPSTKQTIQIGSGASSKSYSESVSIGRNALANGSESVCIGKAAGLQTPSTSNQIVAIGYGAGQDMTGTTGSVSLGAKSKATRRGEVNIGSTDTSYGYNSTNYRVLGGVHDGQDAHDAVTVSQVNSVIDAINTALSTNISHIGA